MSQIQGGLKLKKVSVEEKSSAPPEEDLLSQIRGGFKLKKVEVVEKPKVKVEDNSMVGKLQSALDIIGARVQDSDSDTDDSDYDSSDDSDWD